MTTPTYDIYHAAGTSTAPARSYQRTTGLVMSGIAVLFLTFDAMVKLLARPEAAAGTQALGFDPGILLPLGALQAALLLLYLVPRTAVLGAIVWTGYLGGAVATHVRLENPWFSHILFPVYVAALIWGGLWLRDARVRALLRPAPASRMR